MGVCWEEGEISQWEMGRQEEYKLCNLKQCDSNVLKVSFLKCLLKNAKLLKYLRKESCLVFIGASWWMLIAMVLFPNSCSVNYGLCLKKICGWWVGGGRAGVGGRLNHQNSREFSVLCKEHCWPLHGCTASSVGASLEGCLAPRAAELAAAQSAPI